ncbi:MAG: BTAD domain-containing putative transcriptional regulator [Pseudomonadota bacterium]
MADRQSIAGLLWPNSTDKLAQGSLRTSLKALREALGEDAEHILETGNTQVLLRGDRIIVDVDQVYEMVDADDSGVLAQALELVQSDIAEGLVVREPEPAEWLDNARERIRQRIMDLAERKLRARPFTDSEDPLLIRYLSELCLRLDPTFEYAHYRLLDYYAQTNQAPLALKHYRRCREILWDQVGADPGKDIETLVAQIKNETGRASPSPQSHSNRPILFDPSEVPRLVVRAEEADTGVGGLKSFDKRLSAALSKFRTFHVSARSGSVDQGDSSFQVAPARFRIDYTMGRQSEKDVVTLFLTDKRSDTLLWSRKYDLPDAIDEDGYDTLINDISNVVESEVRRGHLAFRSETRTAFELWLDADQLAENFQPEDDRRAELILRNLIDEGADFSRVHSTLASIQLKKRLFDPLAVRNPNILDAARRHAHQAVRMDPHDAVNYQTLGWVYYQQRNAGEGKELFEKAHKFNSVSAMVSIACAEAFAYAGEADRAISLTDKVFRSMSTPPYFYGYLATIFFARGDYPTCINMCELGPPDSLELLVLKASATANASKKRPTGSIVDRVIQLAISEASDQKQVGREDIGYWLSDINMFFEPSTRTSFFDGLRTAGLECPPDREFA